MVAISGDCEGLTNLNIKNGGKFLIYNRIMYKYVTWKPSGVNRRVTFGKKYWLWVINFGKLGRGGMMENVKKMNEEIKKMKKMKEDEEDERI